ncbi:MAG: hydrogenase/urease maturation nickel metallochaperone HypA [Chloroflexota bacterium]
MHETGIARSLVREVQRVARRYGENTPDNWAISSVRVRMGALCPFSEDHLREHFTQAAQGTAVERARLVVEHAAEPLDSSTLDAEAQHVVLLSINVEDAMPLIARTANVSAGRPT